MRTGVLVSVVLLLLLPRSAWTADPDTTAIEEVVPGKVRLAIDPGRHAAPVRHVAFSPDSRTLYTAGQDGTLQLWNVATGERFRVIRRPLGMSDNEFPSFAPLPDGRRIAINCGSYYDKRVRPGLLDLETGAITPLAPVPPGRKAAPPQRSVVDLRYVEALANSYSLQVSPDGKYLAGFQSFTEGVLLWKLDTTQDPVQLATEKNNPLQVRFSPDGRVAVICADELVLLWDLKDGVRSLPSLKHDANVAHLLWLPDGKHLLTATRSAVHYWDVEAGRVLRTWTARDARYNLGPTFARATSNWITSLACPKQGTRVLVTWAGNVKGNWVARRTILDTATGEAREGHRIDSDSSGVIDAISPDGKQAVTVGGLKVDLWSVDRPGAVRHLADDSAIAMSFGWGNDNRTIAWDGPKTPGILSHALDLAELGLRVSNKDLPGVAPSYLELRGWKLLPEPLPKRNTFAVEHNGVKLPDLTVDYTTLGLLLASGKEDVLLASWDRSGFSIGLYDPVKGRVGTISGQGYEFRPVAGSPDGRYLLTYNAQLKMEIHSVEARKRLLSVYVHGEEWIAWTDEGYYAASPGGERMVGWLVQEDPNKIPTFHPASRFHKQMYRPDIIKLVLETGDVKAAIEQANKAAKKERAELPKLLPPFVEIQLDTTKLPAEVTVKAVARAAAVDQPVTALQLLLDGRPGDVVGFKVPVKMGEKASGQWTLKLPPGPHRLAVLARSPDSTALSDVAEVNGPTLIGSTQSRIHRLCVGVAHYANNGKGGENNGLDLKYPIQDAPEVDATFAKYCADGKLFAPGQSKILLDKDATTQKVLAELERLSKDRTLESGDLLVVFFSGHGERAEDGSLYLLTHEADRRDLKKTSLSGEKLKDALAKIPCRVLLLLDACHSSALGPPYRVTTELAMLLNQEDCGAAVIAAARSKEFALEQIKDKDTDKEIPNGLFTWALKEGLAGKAKVDERDHRLYIHDLYQYVFSEVRYQSNGRQHPCLGAPLGGKPVALLERGSATPGDNK